MFDHLATLIAKSFKSEEDPASTITVTEAPTSGDLAEVSIDIVGLGDDSIRGFRLHIFAVPNSGGFTLKSIEQTIICGRGITTDGLCP